MKSSPESPDLAGSLRIIDANANRAAEGLRVVEEYLRFVLDDPHLCGQCKNLRHELTAALRPVQNHSLRMRDSRQDVGREIGNDREYRRPTAVDVVAASLKRVQQALRCLEEYGKQVEPSLGHAFEHIRYQAYDLESAVRRTTASQDRFRDAQLYVLVDGGESLGDFERRVKSLLSRDVHLLQLRGKTLEDRDLLARARLLRQLTVETETKLIINDRPDLSLLAHADGVHLGQTDMTVSDARRIVGPDQLIGVSTHSIEQAAQAVIDGADYIGVGPLFPSTTKAFTSFPGLSLLQHVHVNIGLPAFGIGGVTLDRLPQILETGCDRVAVGAAIWNSTLPRQAVQEFHAVLEGSASRRRSLLTLEDK